MDEADRWLLRRKGLVEKRIDALRASVGRGESAGGDVGRTESFSQKKEEEEEEEEGEEEEAKRHNKHYINKFLIDRFGGCYW